MENDFDIAMVCMTGARRGRQSARLTARSSNPAKSEELDNGSEGHETPVTDEDALPTNKNTGTSILPYLEPLMTTSH